MSKRLILAASLLALTTACTEEVGLIDEDRNFGGRGGNSLEPVMDILDRSPPPVNPLRNAYLGAACAYLPAMRPAPRALPR